MTADRGRGYPPPRPESLLSPPLPTPPTGRRLPPRLRALLPPVEELVPAGLVALCCLVVAGWIFHPILGQLGDHIVGDADTDAVRGMWGLDHLRRSLLPLDTPIWSKELNFPFGVLALVLPFVSGLLAAPVGLVFGPLAGFDLVMILLVAAAGFGTAVLVRIAGESWPAGLAAAGATMSPPMLLHAVCDGTPEHVAIWLVPLFLAAAVALARRPSVPVGVLAGSLAVLVAFDSPYHGVYAALIGILVLPFELVRPWPPHRRKDLARALGAAAVPVAVGGLVLGLLYRNFPIDEQIGLRSEQLWKMNAADLHTWWQYDFGQRTVRDPSLAPTAIPAGVLWAGLGLGLLGAPRSLPWLAAGLGAVILSFGYNDRIPQELAQWLGSDGQELGRTILRWNQDLYALPGIGSVRFPRRWLVPATLCLSVAGGMGLARVFWLLSRPRLLRRPVTWGAPVVGLVLTVLAARAGVQTARFHAPFPAHALPEVAFTDWVRDQPGSGAAVLLPQMRPAPASGKRGDLPVFASIADSLSSSDVQYLQVRMGRPLLSYPSLKTLVPMKVDTDLYRLLRNWDDIAHPQLTGRPIPSSAHDERSEPFRQRVIDGVRQDGLRFVIVDEAAYAEEGMAILRAQLSSHLVSEEHFDDGTGVTVFELRQ